MGIAARGLKGGENGRRHGAAGNHKTLAEYKILEPALLRHHAMLGGIELGHGWFPARNFASWQMACRYRRGVVAANTIVVPAKRLRAPGPNHRRIDFANSRSGHSM
jgi:hypothetical protein